GVDDDGDGAVDCADRKCATSVYCAQALCRPDQAIDPVPLDGSTVSKLVQTAGASVQAKPACESTPGGPTAVVAVRLTAKADLKLTWNQLGNHDFALYSQVGTMLPCDAGTLVSCNPSAGMGVGMTQWSAVPAGRYYLVVAADTPTSAGSVALQLSG